MLGGRGSADFKPFAGKRHLDVFFNAGPTVDAWGPAVGVQRDDLAERNEVVNDPHVLPFDLQRQMT